MLSHPPIEPPPSIGLAGLAALLHLLPPLAARRGAIPKRFTLHALAQIGLATRGGPFVAELTPAGRETLRALGPDHLVGDLAGIPAPPVCSARSDSAAAVSLPAIFVGCDASGAKPLALCGATAPATRPEKARGPLGTLPSAIAT
jgi:hypothetical protein